MYVKASTDQRKTTLTANIRCPKCRKMGTFDKLADDLLLLLTHHGSGHTVGIRHCPDPICAAVVFVVWNAACEIERTYPAERLDFESSHIPEEIVDNMEQALTCHASQCYIAAAIMIRRGLELLCEAQAVEGKDLKDRIKALEKTIMLPRELLEAMDRLRLLGNDAAHVKAKTFASIGKPQVEVGIEFLKEILKATYQYKGLLQKLSDLEEPAPGEAGT